MADILITGSEGFFGKNLCKYFREKGIKFKKTDLDKVNLTSIDETKKLITKVSPKIVINCATGNYINKNYEPLVAEHNLRMFFNLYESINSDTVLITFGSGSEFNRLNWQKNMDESFLGKFLPADSHSFSKYVISNFVTHQKKKKVLLFRVFGVYGPYEDYQFKFISNSIAKALFNIPITINQNCIYDYVYIDDVCRLCLDIYKKKSFQKNFIGNFTPNSSIELLQIAKIIQKLIPDTKIKVLKENIGTFYTGNNKKFLDNFGPFTFTSYEEGIFQLFTKLKRNKKILSKEILLKDDFIKYAKKLNKNYFEKNE